MNHNLKSSVANMVYEINQIFQKLIKDAELAQQQINQRVDEILDLIK